jgi:hypothetical protein
VLETSTLVSDDEPGDFGVVTGATGRAGWGHTAVAVVDVTAPPAVLEVLGATVVGAVVETAVDVLPVDGDDADVDVEPLLPLLLHAASTTTAKQTQTVERRTTASWHPMPGPTGTGTIHPQLVP